MGEGAALTDIAFEPVSSTEVSVAGKRNFQGKDKETETALEIQGRRCRDKISLGNSANSGLIAGFREILARPNSHHHKSPSDPLRGPRSVSTFCLVTMRLEYYRVLW